MNDPEEAMISTASTPQTPGGTGDELSQRWRSRRKRKSDIGAGPEAAQAQGKIMRASSPTTIGVWVVSLALVVWGAFTPNPALTFGSALVMPLLFKLLWRQGEAPLLLAGCFGQWLQVVMPLIVANYYGQPLEAYFGIPFRNEATWLGLIGVVAFAFGLRLALFGCDLSIGPAVEREVAGFTVNRLFLAWVFSLAVAVPIDIICRLMPGLTQVIGPILGLKTGFVFLMGYAVARQQRGYAVFAFVVVMEFLIGTLGYFSGFTQVLIVLLILLLTVMHSLTLRVELLLFLALAAVMIASASVWSAIKPGYRDFLNGGSGKQEVVAPVAQRLDYLSTHIRAMNENKFADGFETTLLRIGYTEYFADTLNNVPKEVPYARGRLWLEAVTRIFMPRMFFPDKTAVDDSARTKEYSGVNVAGAEEGASIGLGYMVESYVDFGPYFMFLPIFLLALLFGLAYRYFVLGSRMGSWGYVIAFAMPFASLHIFETSNIKLVGPLVSCAILFVPLNYYFGQSIKVWLQGGAASFPRRPRRKGKDISP
jgi:hypothetical protein